MDGHGGYVWMAYALTTMAVVLMVWLPLARFRRHLRWVSADQLRQAGDSQL
jgi:heme exporter protein CcmD